MLNSNTPSTTATAAPLLTTLHDGQPGVRTLVQIETREPDGGGLATAGSTAVLDFISSTATLDRYHEVIEPTGWRLDSYRRNPVFQNAHNYGGILFTLGKAVFTEVRARGQNSLCLLSVSFQRWKCQARPTRQRLTLDGAWVISMPFFPSPNAGPGDFSVGGPADALISSSISIASFLGTYRRNTSSKSSR
jgi:hypothetical protein